MLSGYTIVVSNFEGHHCVWISYITYVEICSPTSFMIGNAISVHFHIHYYYYYITNVGTLEQTISTFGSFLISIYIVSIIKLVQR